MGVFLAARQLFLAFCQMLGTTGGYLQKYLPVLASCQCCWQGAKFGKSPRPKHRATARCEAYLSMNIRSTHNSVSILIPWAVDGPHGQLASLFISSKQAKVMKSEYAKMFLSLAGHLVRQTMGHLQDILGSRRTFRKRKPLPDIFNILLNLLLQDMSGGFRVDLL